MQENGRRKAGHPFVTKEFFVYFREAPLAFEKCYHAFNLGQRLFYRTLNLDF